MEHTERPANGEVRVSGEMTIYRANEVAQTLFAATREHGGDLCLDLSEVTELDTAGLQVLLMARRQAQASGRRLGFVHASDCVTEVLQLCNVPLRSR